MADAVERCFRSVLDGLSPSWRALSGSWSAGCGARGKAEVAARSIRVAWARGRPDGFATRGRTHWSEHVDWRFDRDRRRCSRSVLVAWPRPDVRRWCSRRGSKHQAKARGRPFHPGATGERQSGRVKNLNLRLMSRYGQLRRWDAVAEHRDWSLRSGRRRLRSPLSWEEHRRPRDTGGCARRLD